MIEKGIDSAKAVTVITGMWTDWKKSRESKERIWDDEMKHYLTYIDEGKFENWPWRCKVSRPVSQEIVDTVSAAVKTALFPDNEDFFQVEGLDDTGMQFASVVKEYLKNVLFKMRFVSSMGPFIKQSCMIGNTTAGLPWRKESVSRRRWQDGVVVPHRQVTWDSTRIETHDMFDTVFEPRTPFYSQETTRIRRKIIHIDELKGKKDFYSNLSDEKLKGGDTPSEASDSDRKVRRNIYGINEGVLDKSKDVELLILNGDINLDGTIYRDRWAVIANRAVLLMFIPNPYWCGNNHIFSSYTDFHSEMLGRGPLEPIRGLQKLIDTFSCQKADVANQIIGGFWAYENDGVIDPENLIARPFGLVECEDVNNIKSLVPTANPTLAFNEIEELRVEAERSSGASKFAQGVVMPGRRTATEALQIGSGSNNRFNNIVTHIGEMAIEPALNMILQQQFQYNYGSPLLPPPAWEGMYKVTFNGARNSAVRELAIQMFANFTEVMGRNPIFAQFLNPAEVAQEWMTLLGIKNKKIIRQKPLAADYPQLGTGQGQGGTGGFEPEKAGQLLG